MALHMIEFKFDLMDWLELSFLFNLEAVEYE